MSAPNRNPSEPGNDATDLAVRRRRLAFRSWHRGTREADLLIGSFADANLPRFGPAELDAYEAILERSDPDIYNWVSGREEPPADVDGPVLRALMAHRIAPKS